MGARATGRERAERAAWARGARGVGSRGARRGRAGRAAWARGARGLGVPVHAGWSAGLVLVHSAPGSVLTQFSVPFDSLFS